MTSPAALFDLPDGAQLVITAAPLSADQRRTQLQRQRIASGYHPLSGAIAGRLKLHPNAPPLDDRLAPGPRCGSCWYRELVGAGGRTVAKCMVGAVNPTDLQRHGYAPRWTHSAASDVRAWWPACVDYSPGDQRVSPDAARFIPDEVSRG